MGKDKKHSKKEKKQKKSKKEKKKSKKRKHEETEEQRQARKAKKSQKRIASSFGYTNDTNPFNDPNLSAPFVWGKKDSAESASSRGEGKSGKSQAERFAEIEKVRKRREEREQEKVAQENLKLEEERLRASMQYVDWERKEREFHLTQMEKRTEIRVNAGRETLIDMLAKNYFVWQRAENAADLAKRGGTDSSAGRQFLIRANENGEAVTELEVELETPTSALDGLPPRELRKLAAEIAERVELVDSAYKSVEEEEGGGAPLTGANSAPPAGAKATAPPVSKSAGVQYWRDLKTLSVAALASAGGASRGGGRGGSSSSSSSSSSSGGGSKIHAHVRAKVMEMFRGKLLSELDATERDVQSNITAAAAGVDVEYMELVLREIEVSRARARLRAFHRAVLGERLEKLKKEHVVVKEVTTTAAAEGDDDVVTGAAAAAAAAAAGGMGVDEDEDEDEDLSPLLLQDVDEAELAAAEATRDDDEDAALRAERRRVYEREHGIGSGTGTGASSSAAAAYDDSASANAMYQREKRAGMEADAEGVEELLKDEIDMPEASYAWADKYRPRRPRYFNRVKTGYDWNKYNRSHYDHDNPPPKTVQGYKFNIFYPDLVDRTATPQYYLEATESDDFCVIRFSAGPPCVTTHTTIFVK